MDKNAEIKWDKQLRLSLDAELQKLKELPKSEERTIASIKLKEVIMWLGMDLKRLAAGNPYPDSYKPDNINIAPPADGLTL